MNRIFSRFLWAIAGVCLIIAGIFCIGNPGAALSTMSLFLGLAMLISGIVDIVIFAKGRGVMYGSGWFLVDGILTVILSLFLLFNQTFTTLTLPFIFGMWLLFSGITKFVDSFELKRFGVRGWGWFTALGVILALAGFLSFMDPVLSMLTLSMMLSFMLILQGVSSILRAVFSDRFFM